MRRASIIEIKKTAMEPQDEAQLVGVIPHKNGEELRIRLTHFQGDRRLDIRFYVLNREGEMIPTKKGITVQKDFFNEFFGILDCARTDLMKLAQVE